MKVFGLSLIIAGGTVLGFLKVHLLAASGSSDIFPLPFVVLDLQLEREKKKGGRYHFKNSDKSCYILRYAHCPGFLMGQGSSHTLQHTSSRTGGVSRRSTKCTLVIILISQ